MLSNFKKNKSASSLNENQLKQNPLFSGPVRHYVNGNLINGAIPKNHEQILFGMGCFWGAEKIFWETLDIFVTAVGYSAGNTSSPSYEEVCSGVTGHNEVVQITFSPLQVSYDSILKSFWENHNPTQGMRQGNDIGTQYRSGIYCSSEGQLKAAKKSKTLYQQSLLKIGLGKITTEIELQSEFYFAEKYHQQYLAKNPNGYCGLGGTGALFN